MGLSGVDFVAGTIAGLNNGRRLGSEESIELRYSSCSCFVYNGKPVNERKVNYRKYIENHRLPKKNQGRELIHEKCFLF